MVSLRNGLASIYRALSGKGLAFFIPKRLLAWFRGVATKQYQDQDDIVVLDVGEYKYHFYPRSNDELLLWGVYERGVSNIIEKVSKSYDIFVDVGACYGYFTLIAESNRKIAIEPDPENYQVLETNIEENNIDAELVKKAIVEKNGLSVLYRSQNRKRHSLTKEHLINEVIEEIEVETTTLDGLLQGNENKSILFKIDVEGLEPKVFQGMKNLLKQEDIAIIFEYNPQINSQEEKQVIFNTVKYFSPYLIDDIKGTAEYIDFESLQTIEERCNIFLSKKEFVD